MLQRLVIVVLNIVIFIILAFCLEISIRRALFMIGSVPEQNPEFKDFLLDVSFIALVSAIGISLLATLGYKFFYRKSMGKNLFDWLRHKLI